MKAVCKISEQETTYPCPVRACPLFADCLTEYEAASKKSITNADRIRSMNDNQLATVILEASRNNIDSFFCHSKKECSERLDKDEDIPESECLSCVKAWLRMPRDEAPRPRCGDFYERQESGLLEDD